MKDMKAKAESSIAVMDSVSADESKLKFVLTKLRASGDTLKKIDRWMATIKELEQELKNGEYDYYRIVADLLQEVLESKEQFVMFRAMPYVMAILEKVAAIELELKRQVQWTFREIGPLASSDPEANPNESQRSELNLDMKNLNQVYLVVDVLGYDFRRDLLERFAQLQLLQYEKAFKYGTKYCGLDSLDRRYAWFRYLLKIVDDKFRDAFPKRWCVPLHLFCEFTRRTKKHLADYLADVYKRIDENDPGKYVGMVLGSLKSILTFEAEMKASFDVRMRGEDDDDEDENANLKHMIEPIADAFDPYLGPYVILERDELDKMMFKLNEDETREQYSQQSSKSNNSAAAEDGSTPDTNKGPYDSSRQMFEYIKASLKRCTTFSTGVTYLSLSREYRVCLHNYAQTLKFRCPSPVAAEAGKPPMYSISPAEEIAMCRLVCTGEYCMDTIPQLEAKMKEHIKDEYREDIDFAGQIDAYVDTISFTMSIMIAGILTRLEPHFKSMRKIDWSTVNTVGDDSVYAKDIRKLLNETIPRIRANMSRVYFQNFNLKLVTAILDKLNENIWKLKRIATTGAGQLLLDLNGLKFYFLRMPYIGYQSGTPMMEEYQPSKAYQNFVSNRIAKIEVVLKLVCLEDEQLPETFAVLWPDGTKEDYDAVVDLKARTGIAAPLDKVGGLLKTGANTVGLGAVGSAVKGSVTGGGKSVFGGITHAAGDLKGLFMGASLFDDSHSSSHPPHPPSGQSSKPKPAGNGTAAASTATASAPAAAAKKPANGASGMAGVVNAAMKATSTNGNTPTKKSG
jgi:vacuolar protein sorting-associated protein 53